MQDDDTMTIEDQYLRLLAMAVIDDDTHLKEHMISEGPVEAVKMFKGFLACLYDFPPRALSALLVTYRPDVEALYRALHECPDDKVMGFEQELLSDTNFEAVLASLHSQRGDVTLH